MEKLRDKMWFRLSGGGSSGADSADDASPTSTSSINNSLTVPSSGGSEPSRFEKFRRASFRRKSTGHMPTRKRSKSPHFILQADKSTSLEEADEDAEKERNNAVLAQGQISSGDAMIGGSLLACPSQQSLYHSEVNILLNGVEGHITALPLLSDPKPEHKKTTLKSIKTDPPKRKFYKFSSSLARRHGSFESAEVPPAVSTLARLGEYTPKSTHKQPNARVAASVAEYSDEEDDNDDDDEDADTDSTDSDDESSDADADQLSPQRGNGKEKILLTDPKFKHNRIEKSSSKTKMTDLEKRESLKRSRSARKIAAAERVAAAAAAVAASSAVTAGEEAVSPQKKKDKRAEKEAAKKQSRGHNNLNLNALVKFVMSNKKFLNTEEFTFTRRKSVSEVATTAITLAATCKPMPIALKYPPENVVAETPKEHDTKAERNVILVKKQNLKNSFCDHLNNNNNECGSDKNKKKKQKKQKKKSVELEECVNREIYKCIAEDDTQKALDAKVKRNSSNSSKSSKSSGNFEDEAFYSCDELEREERARASGSYGGGGSSRGGSVSGVEASPSSNTSGSNSSATNSLSPPIFVSTDEAGTQTTDVKRKTSSPSLTSRVAAKINEKTNNYRNRRAVAAAAAAAASKVAKKQRKGQMSLTTTSGGVGVCASAGASASAEKRAEFYKQLSVERLHTSSIVRQPSDRRPDAGNQALRSNGNATTSADNTDDVQLRLPSSASYPASGPGGESSAGVAGKGALGRGTRESNVPLPGDAADLSAATDTNAQDAAEGKDARRERLHQQHQQNKSAPVSVNRSESYKERLSQKRNRNSRRKTSDPSLTSRPNDEQADVGLSNSNYTASSNSSLSSGGGSESPSTSMEQMGGAGGATATVSGHPIAHHHSMHAHHNTSHHHMHQHSHQDSFHGSIGSGSMNTSFWGSSFGGVGSGAAGQRPWNFESDDDDDLNEADWSSNVTAELLAALTDAEKKRQEIINEIYQTERSHVRILKLLERLFLLPLQESSLLTPEHLVLLFPPALLSLREIHSTFEQQLKQRRVEHNHVVTHIGDLLSSMFYGKSGDELCQYAAQFCARQQIALEALKEKRRKDEQLQKLLNKAESHKACRRLQLKDLLPAVLQRLTKYPLLFENLYKVTIRVVPENTTEAEAIQCALESSKKILVDVNQAVKTAEDAHKLQNIQKKLDKSTFDKDEFKNLDLTQYRLIHDGSLTMKKNPSIQLHGLLFEDMIVLLTKQDDKYSLKYLHATRNMEVNNKPVSPIMSIDSETLVRQEAADKNSFFLIKTKTSQMLELRAPSSSECKTWFKHISDAAEQYKPRSKNANHEPVDDPAIATLPHSNTKESLELTPERPPPASATATVTTTPLAPMMPIATATSVNVNNNNNNNNDQHNVQLRNGRRESTSTAGSADHKMRLSHNELSPSIGSSSAALSSASTASLSSSSAVNRTMSTRSCGEPNNNNGGYENSSVTLRHTQSARQANGHNVGAGADEFGSNISGTSLGSGSKRDSASIVYSNNSNNTRTLMQSSPPLVEPTAIQISISPAHTAEPVLTPAERLRRLDASIRDGLLEKQKIICDMFRLPVEHFHEIVDIAAMPEAPKDSADIALAAYAQVQSLTEVLNDYMHVTPEHEISAVSTAVCDQCHEKQQQQHHHHSQRPLTPLTAASSNSSSTSTMNSTGSSTTTQIAATSSVAAAATLVDTPPPLPPPNKQIAQQQTPTAKTPTSTRTVLQNALLDEDIHEDDDGYCEIDELRLPALPPSLASKATKASSPPPPLPPPAGNFKAPPLPPPPAATVTTQHHQLQQEERSSSNAVTTNSTLPEENTKTANAAELVKRQSTISADSIPEESADEVTQALSEDKEGEPITGKEEDVNIKEDDSTFMADPTVGQTHKEEAKQEKIELEVKEEVTSGDEKKESDENKTADDIANATTTVTNDLAETTAAETTGSTEPQNEQNASKECEETADKPTTTDATIVCGEKKAVDTAAPTTTTTASTNNTHAEEHMEVNDAYETLSTLSSKLSSVLTMVDNSTQTIPTALATIPAIVNTNTNLPVHCGPNRIQHANSLEPSVPCHALNTIVSSLNSQISLLLPKINERDMERERLRKENQHLRELLNAMHERQRVEAKLETPTDANAMISAGDTTLTDETDGDNVKTSTPKINSNSPADLVAAADSTPMAPSVGNTATQEGVNSITTKSTVNNTTTKTSLDQATTPTTNTAPPQAAAAAASTDSEN
ncbi:uncharacterized protein LOC129243621 [Anastrepha obliqua]|uniref:uncharacterized protein LOC129243621 n=1 Tax=Anastrepha obliqua TaxID=95512 RepID=UPI00240A216A|nr:uncharacterized protein LOC129243621 [Anastrepha obliqua]XP_054736750.1 uncharacterized protein LOC129243621 [Anastrepha obliqua]